MPLPRTHRLPPPRRLRILARTIEPMLGKAVASPRIVLALAGAQAADAAFNLLPNEWLQADLERLRLPSRARYVFGSVKAASVAGLLLGLWRPSLGRATARGLVAYFVLAVAAHRRVNDRPSRYLPALVMLGWSALAWRTFRKPTRVSAVS